MQPWSVLELAARTYSSARMDKLPTPTMTAKASDFIKDSRVWRKKQIIQEVFGENNFFGSQHILSDEVLVKLAQDSKLTDVATLEKHWLHAPKYGDADYLINL